MSLTPRDFFDQIVLSKSNAKASSCWPWLFRDGQFSLSRDGLYFSASNAKIVSSEGLDAVPFKQMELAQDGYWVRSLDSWSILLGSSVLEGSRDRKMPLPVAAGLSFLLASQGWVIAHAALLRPESSARAVLVTGESGAGKTTLCINALRCGWRVYSDDFVAIRSDGTGIFGFGLRDFLKLREKNNFVPVEPQSGPVEICEIWALSSAASRPEVSAMASMSSQETAKSICDALSFGFLLLGGRMPEAVRSQLLMLSGRKFFGGFDLIEERSKVLSREGVFYNSNF